MMKKFLPLLVLVVSLMMMFASAQTLTQAATLCNDIGGTDSNLPPCSNVGYVDSSADVGKKPTVGNGFSISSIVNTAMSLVNWFSWFVGLAAVVMGLYSGFLFITARDDANQITTARKTMMYAIIGIAVAIISFSLVAISKGIFNLNL